MRLEGKVALVTGGGSGIGRSVALLFAQEGASIVVNDINIGAAEKTIADIGSGLAVTADVADPGAVRQMFEAIAKQHDRLDVLVNNAGIGEASGDEMANLNRIMEARIGEMMGGQGITTQWEVTENLTDENWDRMIRVHLYGMFHCTREALKIMGAGGAIVNMSSILGLQGAPAVPHYAAAKGGILAFTKSVAQEVGSRGIRVNAICPGWIGTPMTETISPMLKMMAVGQTPLGRLGSPEEIARTALYLASEDSSFTTGQWLSPNGGLVIQ
ncbi:MAG: SDR family NAD(P)-dependent oxidoreductase [Actinomycetota bacterium]|nr:SDR family oxidoreductase [Actinomycetota bacterium]